MVNEQTQTNGNGANSGSASLELQIAKMKAGEKSRELAVKEMEAKASRLKSLAKLASVNGLANDVKGMIRMETEAVRWAQMNSLAEALVGSSMIPKDFSKEKSNIIAALEYRDSFAQTGISIPLSSVMTNLTVVHGRTGWQAKMLSALLNSSGLIKGIIRYKFSGDGSIDKPERNFGCQAVVTLAENGEELLGPKVTWGLAVDEGWTKDHARQGGGVQKSKWNTMREVMFQYRSVSFLVNHYFSHLLNGMSSVDELEDAMINDVLKNGSQDIVVMDSEAGLEEIDKKVEEIDKAAEAEVSFSEKLAKQVKAKREQEAKKKNGNESDAVVVEEKPKNQPQKSDAVQGKPKKQVPEKPKEEALKQDNNSGLQEIKNDSPIDKIDAWKQWAVKNGKTDPFNKLVKAELDINWTAFKAKNIPEAEKLKQANTLLGKIVAMFSKDGNKKETGKLFQ